MKIRQAFPSLVKIAPSKYNDGKNVGEFDTNSQFYIVIRTPFKDPVSGKKGIFEREERICDYVAENSLFKTNPAIASQWCYAKNTIKPTEIACDSDVEVYWERPMTDKNGVRGVFIWTESVSSRVFSNVKPSIATKTTDDRSNYQKIKNLLSSYGKDWLHRDDQKYFLLRNIAESLSCIKGGKIMRDIIVSYYFGPSEVSCEKLAREYGVSLSTINRKKREAIQLISEKYFSCKKAAA